MTTITQRQMQPRYVALRQEREQRILRKAATPEGWGRKDFAASSGGDIFVQDAKRMAVEGRLFPAPHSNGNRYFTTAELRDAFSAAKARARGRPAGAGTKSGAQWSANAEAKIPSHVQIQRAPTPKGRYEVDGPIENGFLSEWKALRASNAYA